MGRCFKYLVSHYPTLIWLSRNSFPRVESVLPLVVIGEWSPPILISTHEPLVAFSFPCPAEEGSERAALVGTWCPSRFNHHNCKITQTIYSHLWINMNKGPCCGITNLSSRNISSKVPAAALAHVKWPPREAQSFSWQILKNKKRTSQSFEESLEKYFQVFTKFPLTEGILLPWKMHHYHLQLELPLFLEPVLFQTIKPALTLSCISLAHTANALQHLLWKHVKITRMKALSAENLKEK